MKNYIKKFDMLALDSQKGTVARATLSWSIFLDPRNAELRPGSAFACTMAVFEVSTKELFHVGAIDTPAKPGYLISGASDHYFIGPNTGLVGIELGNPVYFTPQSRRTDEMQPRVSLPRVTQIVTLTGPDVKLSIDTLGQSPLAALQDLSRHLTTEDGKQLTLTNIIDRFEEQIRAGLVSALRPLQ